MSAVKMLERWERLRRFVVMRLKVLEAVVAFVVNRSSIGCCGDFWEAMQQSWSVLWHRGEGLR